MNCRIFIANDTSSTKNTNVTGCGKSGAEQIYTDRQTLGPMSFTWVSSTGRKGQRAERRERTREMRARAAAG